MGHVTQLGRVIVMRDSLETVARDARQTTSTTPLAYYAHQAEIALVMEIVTQPGCANVALDFQETIAPAVRKSTIIFPLV